MKKLILITIGLILLSTSALAYNPNTYTDEEILTVNGKRPKVDIEAQELIINIDADDFIDGVVEKTTTISNIGNKTCTLTVTLSNVPVDLNVHAYVDTDVLGKKESTTLTIVVELGDMQDVEDFTFNVIVEAEML